MHVLCRESGCPPIKATRTSLSIGAIGIEVINISLDRSRIGEELTINCSVETCLDDVVVQFFMDDQLLDSVTVPDRHMLMASAQLKVSTELVGRKYACQAMSEKYNEVTRAFFTVKGMEICTVTIIAPPIMGCCICRFTSAINLSHKLLLVSPHHLYNFASFFYIFW